MHEFSRGKTFLNGCSWARNIGYRPTTQNTLRAVPSALDSRSRNRDGSVRGELARSAKFSLTESAGEAEGAAYAEYVFTFTFPEDTDVSNHVVHHTLRLSEVASAEEVGDQDCSDDGVTDP